MAVFDLGIDLGFVVPDDVWSKPVEIGARQSSILLFDGFGDGQSLILSLESEGLSRGQ
jgi:hypothetical protein